MKFVLQVHWAVRNKHPDILRRLIGRGWLVDEEGKHGDTPLCVASEDESAAACECINILSIAGVRTEYFFHLPQRIIISYITGTVAPPVCHHC